LKLLHLSDTHGTMPPLSSDADVIVHSGDILPNRTFGIRPVEETFQRYWLEEHAAKIRTWIGSRPFLVCPGNHDFIDPTPYLRDAGVDAHSLCDRFLEIDGVRFYGYPWVPVFGPWNWMASPRERLARLVPAVERMDAGEIDVFVAHGPMFGVLDRNAEGERCGSRVLRDALREARFAPKFLLHGHIHEAAGVQGWSRGMIVSNAARTQRVLEVST